MWPTPAVLTALLLLCLPLAAQQGPPPFTPPLDHWLTLDSLVQTVGLDSVQRRSVADPYRALNAVLKQAADKRAELRRRSEGQPRPTSPDTMTPESGPDSTACGSSSRRWRTKRMNGT